MSEVDPRNREFVRLVLQAEPRLYAWIRAQIPHRADAEEVLQETVTILWSKFSEFRAGTNFLSWALSVAYFEVRQHHRKQAQERRLFSEAFLELVARTADGMSDELADLRDALAACLEKLNAADRDVVHRCYTAGSTVGGVAAELNRPYDTVKSVLRRSRRSLYECIRRTLDREGRQ